MELLVRGVRTDFYPPPFTRTNGDLYQTAGVLERLKHCALKGLSRADVVVWLADSGQKPVEQKTLRVTNPVNHSPYIISNVYISHSYCKHFGCRSSFHSCSSPTARMWQTGFFGPGLLISQYAGEIIVSPFIILTGFQQIQGFVTFDSKYWLLMAVWMGPMSKQHKLMRLCEIRTERTTSNCIWPSGFWSVSSRTKLLSFLSYFLWGKTKSLPWKHENATLWLCWLILDIVHSFKEYLIMARKVGIFQKHGVSWML